jgi:hypothetical protein
MTTWTVIAAILLLSRSAAWANDELAVARGVKFEFWTFDLAADRHCR